MKSSEKITIGQIEKGEDIEKISEKANDNQVVHRDDRDETIEGEKKFKKSPQSDSPASSNKELVRKEEMDNELNAKAEDDSVVHKDGNKTENIDGKKTFEKAPKSNKDANSGSELVRKSQMDSELGDKVDKEAGKGLSTNDFSDSKKQKLSGIESGAEKNVVNKVNGKTGNVQVDANDVDESGDRKWARETGADVTEDHTSADSEKLGGHKPSYFAQDSKVVKKSEKGEPGGIAELNSSGKVKSSQLPETAANVVTKDTKDNFPNTGQEDTIYIASDTGYQYVWTGVDYSNISGNDLQLGETSSTAYRGDRGKEAYDHSKKTSSNPHDVTKEDVGLEKVKNHEQLRKSQNLSDLPSKSAARSNMGLKSAALKEESHFAKPINIKDGKTTFKQNGKEKGHTKANQDGSKTIEFTDTTYEKATESKKGLMPKSDKKKLNEIEEGSQKNVKSNWFETNEDLDSFIENKQAFLPIIDRFTFYENNDQKFDLSQELHRLISVQVNGQGLTLPQYNKWHNAIEILDDLDDEDIVQISYMTPTDYSRLHGFVIDNSESAPEVTRVGNTNLLDSLPIQNRMKGCLLKDNGEVNYWLDAEDWSKKEDGSASDLTGKEGQVMVRIPRHWRRDTTEGHKRTILFSDKPIHGAKEIPKQYVSPYKATLNRKTEKLASVVNDSVNYRGGNNQSSWDSEGHLKSQLKKPVTKKSRIKFRDYAKNRGKNWYDMTYMARETIAWLITMEYETRNHQSAITNGPVGVSNSKWSDFNSRHPLFQVGLTNDIGNGTGTKTIDLSAHDLGTNEVEVFRYRGIENFWGDIYEWTNDINIIDNIYYRTEGKIISNNNASGYEKIGERPTSSGYYKEMIPGTILPKKGTSGGSSGTYYADKQYANNTESIRAVRFGGAAAYGSPVGSFFSHSTASPSNSHAISGSRLCYVER